MHVIIFLDIDGVMVPAKGWKTPELLDDGFPAFSKSATKILRQFISEDVTVLLTTSHKSRFTDDEWRTIFKNRGIDVTTIHSLPTNHKNVSRKEEILNWFKQNRLDAKYVIIDDDTSLQDLPTSIKSKLVQTSPHVGLTDEHIEVINSILEK